MKMFDAGIGKLEFMGYRMVKKNYNDILSRFHVIVIPARNGQTDGRTDRFAISIYMSVC